VNDAVNGKWKRLQATHGITGEWIVFAKHKGEKYYLALGVHDGALRHQFDAICAREFPFLSSVLGPYTGLPAQMPNGELVFQRPQLADV